MTRGSFKSQQKCAGHCGNAQGGLGGAESITCWNPNMVYDCGFSCYNNLFPASLQMRFVAISWIPSFLECVWVSVPGGFILLFKLLLKSLSCGFLYLPSESLFSLTLSPWTAMVYCGSCLEEEVNRDAPSFIHLGTSPTWLPLACTVVSRMHHVELQVDSRTSSWSWNLLCPRM